MEDLSKTDFIEKTFSYPFDETNFSNLVHNIFNNIELSKSSSWFSNSSVPDNLKKYINNYRIIGTYKDKNNCLMVISMIKLIDKYAVEKSRHVQRDFSKWLIDKFSADACLISFFSDDYDDWRFSFVTVEYTREISTSGKLKANESISPIKRYSYLVGKNEPSHTAKSQLTPLILNKDKSPTLEQVKEAFSVERVTKLFYEEYKKLCLEIVSDIKRLKLEDKTIKFELDKNNIDEFDFAKKIMSQITFLYFLQKKGLLGVKRDKSGLFRKWGSGPKDFVRKLFNKDFIKYRNFYNDILEPLFFDGLARERDDDFFSYLDCKIPFLNGGLFEKYYNWSDSHIIIRNDIIANILDTFDRYNFTVIEEDSMDKEIAIDPEVLGKIFESLIDIKDRKKGGIFYTHREIVNFMCEQTLLNFVCDKLDDKRYSYEKKNIAFLFDNNNNIWESNKILNISNETLSYILKKIKEIKICDPAIGSGAFQLGMLNKLVFAHKKIREKINKYKISDYRLKKHIIQNNLYGVDVENSSVEIARFRLWLSLIIEDESVEKMEPLPNLEYKIVKGNSLSSIKGDLFNTSYLEELSNLKNEFFDEAIISKKIKIKIKILDIEKQIGIENNFDFKFNFSEVFESSNKNPGFDIIIGNPPYIGEQGNKGKFRSIRKDKFNPLAEFYSAKMDYLYFFFHQGVNILKNNGQIAFITSNYYLTATSGKKLREDIKQRTNINALINFNELKIFDSAKGIHNIITILKKNNEKQSQMVNIISTNRTGIADSKVLNLILKGNDKLETDYQKVNEEKLFKSQDNYIFLDNHSTHNLQNSILDNISSNSNRLDSFFFIKQGVVSGCDKVTKSTLNLLKDDDNKNIRLNDGIFVLDLNNERDVEVINSFNNNEKKFLKDFYKNSNIKKYSTDKIPTKKLLYIDWNFKIEKYKNIKNHLLKFSKILKERLSVKEKRHQWYVLSWARKESIFNLEKILVPYRSSQNIFGYNNIEWFCRSDCYIIFKKTNEIPIKTLLGILNSKLFYFWLYLRGKKKGNILELFSTPLSEIPLKIFEKKINDKIEKLVHNNTNNKQAEKDIKMINQIDSIIYSVYQLSEEEIDYVEKFFTNQTKK